MRLDHIAIAVETLEESVAFYQRVLGLEHKDTEEVKEQKVRIALLTAGETRIELLEPTAPDSPVARFLARRGQGLHHLAFRVENIEAVLDRLKKAGAELIDETPKRGVGGSRIAFIHPRAGSGVLIELVETPQDHTSDLPM